MSASLQLAAAKWARAVRDRQAATAALRKAKEAARDMSCFSAQSQLARDLDDRAAEARRDERRAINALLHVIEGARAHQDDVIDIEEAKPLPRISR